MAQIKKISTELQLLDKFLDTSGDAGTPGQVLSSTGAGINWVSGGSLPGGPYLPLSAGASYPLTGDLYLDDDSGATPSLYFKNEANNFWRYLMESGGDFSIKEGTSTRLTFQAGGNVGIGTTSPATKFVVSDAGGTGLEITPQDANTRISLVAYDRLDFAYRELNFDGYNYSFRTSGNVKAVMLNTGNVGIGTTSPSQKLHLQNGILLVNSNTPVSTGIWMPDTNGNPSLRIVTDQSSVTNSSIVNAWGNSSNAGVMVGSTRNDGFAFQVRSGVTLTDGFANDTGNSRMVVLGNGNVGIGTTSPSGKLDVVGASGAAWMNLINGSETAFRLTTFNNGTGNGTNSYAFKHGLYFNSTENAAVTFYRGGSSVGGFLTFTTNNGTEKMRIKPQPATSESGRIVQILVN